MDGFSFLWDTHIKKTLIVCGVLIIVFLSYADPEPPSVSSPKKKQHISNESDEMAQTLVLPEQQPQQDPKQLQKEAMQAETQERISANDGPKQPTRLNESSGDEEFPSLAQSQTEIAGDKASFQPSDRNYSETEKKALSGDLSRETPVESPFVINNDESDALEQYPVEKDPEKKKELRQVITGYPRRRSEVADGSSTKTAAKSSIASTTSSPSEKLVQSTATVADADDKIEEEEEESEDFLYGRAVKEKIEYIEQKVQLPDHLQEVYDHLRVYEVSAGENAHIDLAAYSDHSEYPTPLYQTLPQVAENVQEESNKKLEQIYRFPPDWNNYYKFADDSVQNDKMATALSQKLLLSLGTKGSITFQMVQGRIENGEGPDFVIWENPFCFLNTEKRLADIKKGLKDVFLGYVPFTPKTNTILDKNVVCQNETARISVSKDGSKGSFKAFEPCTKGISPKSSRCAGYGYNAWEANASAMDYLAYGGDHYDLSELGDTFEEVRFIKIEDLGFTGDRFQAGFDLDAIAVIHFSKE